MAQAGTARAAPVGDGDALVGPTEREAFEMGQYRKIVQFRDTVLSGKHPTIKLPPGLKAIADTLPARAKSKSVVDVNGAVSKTKQAVPELKAKAVEVGLEAKAGMAAAVAAAAAAAPLTENATSSRASWTAQRPLISGRTEINPILLEKSEELIRAEFQLQRQRLERSLKDELDERRVSKPPMSLAVFDLSDVLTKALNLVETTAPTLPADEDLTANPEAASDSFDDATFYSSHHDTPESNFTSRVRNLSEASQLLPAASSQKTSLARVPVPGAIKPKSPIREARHEPIPSPPCQPHHDALAHTTGSRLGGVVVPGLNNFAPGASAGIGSSTRRESVAGEGPGLTRASGHGERAPPFVPRPLDSVPSTRPPSPLMRTQGTLAPGDPRNTQVPPPLTVEREPIVISSGVTTAVPTPAQVVTLRNEPVAVISDTSSQGERDQEKRKGKKKKRKADRQAPDTEGRIYIKPEPRSASPITAPSNGRPSKRQRQSENQLAGPDVIDPGYARPSAANSAYDPHHPQIYRQERAPVVYEEPVFYPRRVISTAAVVGEPRYEREYFDEYHMPGGSYVRRAPSPGGLSYQYQYSPREAHHSRAVTQVIVNDPYREPPRVYREPLERTRMSVRPEGDPFVVPPRPPPARIVVDAYGREYIEPPHPPAPRHSVAPSGRFGEPEVVYERVASRAVSGHPGAGPYDEVGGIAYARPPPAALPLPPPPPPPPQSLPPAYAVTRRYVTQPEFISHDYRDMRPRDRDLEREREYSTQPAGPPAAREYVRVMTPHDRRPPPMEDRPPREYITRVASVRPPDAVRYEAPHDYGRMQSARPEAPGWEYAGSAHPESRRLEGAPGFAGEYIGGAGPALQQQQQQHQQPQPQPQPHQPLSQPYLRREYSVRPADRYNEPGQGGRRGEEIAFIEGPGRRTQEIVYVDDGRREVYRA